MRTALLEIGLALFVASACAPLGAGKPAAEPRSVAFVAWFEDYHEVLQGSLAFDPVLKLGFADLRALVGDLRCVGPATVTRMPPRAEWGVDCEGVRGRISMQCSDGRKLELSWRADRSCSAGFGRGRDDAGHTLRAAHGMSHETARAMVGEALAASARSPGLSPFARGTEDQEVRLGTGFFVTDEGHLVTNAHVIHSARRIRVALDDGELIEASLVRADEKNDLALLRVAAIRAPLTVLRRNGLRTGSEVLALGYPLVLQGRELTPASGSVSALSGRGGDRQRAQVDLSLQPGSAGGPLLNRRGQVVGIVSATLDDAVKSDALHVLLGSALGRKRFPDPPEQPDRDFRELVARTRSAVVAILTD